MKFCFFFDVDDETPTRRLEDASAYKKRLFTTILFFFVVID